MIRIQQDTLAYELLTILAYVGEFPFASIYLLGNKDVWRKLVSKLSQEQTYRVLNYPDKITGRLSSSSSLSENIQRLPLIEDPPQEKGCLVHEIAPSTDQTDHG